MTCKLANPARKLAAPLCACILVLTGSGCAGLSFVGGLMTGPLPGGDGGRASPPLGYCVRNWSLPECQNGTTPASGQPQAEPNPAEPAANKKAALGGIAVFLTMLAVALALAGPIASAVAASIYP
jgi:hypothetical protein